MNEIKNSIEEIFDSMREQIDKRSFIYASKDSARRKYIDCSDLDTIINEAEAKWKEDCCEWKYNEFEEQWETSCGVLLNPNSHDREVTHYCCSCGKRIKIAEVE